MNKIMNPAYVMKNKIMTIQTVLREVKEQLNKKQDFTEEEEAETQEKLNKISVYAYQLNPDSSAIANPIELIQFDSEDMF